MRAMASCGSANRMCACDVASVGRWLSHVSTVGGAGGTQLPAVFASHVGLDHDAVELDAAGWTRMLLTVVLIGNRDPQRLAVPLERSAPHALGLPAGGPGTHLSVAADRHPGRSNPDDRSGHRVGCDHNQPR